MISMVDEIYDPMAFAYEGFSSSSSSSSKKKKVRVDATPFMSDPRDVMKGTADMLQATLATQMGIFAITQIGKMVKQ